MTVEEFDRTFNHFGNIRIKPQPKEVVLYMGIYKIGWDISKHKKYYHTHKITFKVDENNKPILDTVKMEEI